MTAYRQSIPIVVLVIVGALSSVSTGADSSTQEDWILQTLSSKDFPQIFQLTVELEFAGKEPPPQAVVILNPGVAAGWKPKLDGWRFDVVNVVEFRKRAAAGELCYLVSDIELRRDWVNVSFVKLNVSDPTSDRYSGKIYAFRKTGGTWSGNLHGGLAGNVLPYDDDE